MKGKTTLRFWLRTDKPTTDGSYPVHLIYQISGQRKYFAVPGIRLSEKNWDGSAAVYAKGLLPAHEIKAVNNKLKEVEARIAKVERQFESNDCPFDVEMVIERLKEMYQPTKKVEPKKFVSDFVETLIEDSRAKIKPGTLKVYRGVKNHLEEFRKKTKRPDTFTNMDVPFLKAFYAYLVGEAGMLNVTAAKQLSTLKTILHKARKEYGIEPHPGYKDYAVHRGDGQFDVFHLTQEEMDALFKLDLKGDRRLNEARDIFIFGCATGLRDSDLRRLEWRHIADGVVTITAHKTDQKIIVPLNRYSSAIIRKYRGTARPLPTKAGVMVSNQKLNKALKDLGKLAGLSRTIEVKRQRGVERITKVLALHEIMSVHMARRTFFTLSLERGIPLQEVMALTGHSTYASAKRYLNVTLERKKSAMVKAWGPSGKK